MEIKYAKMPNIIYGVLALCLMAIPFVRQDPEFDKTIMLKVFYVLVFGAISAYFLYRGLNNKPLYIINADEIVDNKYNATYKLSELSFYKTQTVRFKFSTLSFVNFYDVNKTFVFKIQINGTNCNAEQVINLVKPQLAVLS